MSHKVHFLKPGFGRTQCGRVMVKQFTSDPREPDKVTCLICKKKIPGPMSMILMQYMAQNFDEELKRGAAFYALLDKMGKLDGPRKDYKIEIPFGKINGNEATSDSGLSARVCDDKICPRETDGKADP